MISVRVTASGACGWYIRTANTSKALRAGRMRRGNLHAVADRVDCLDIAVGVPPALLQFSTT